METTAEAVETKVLTVVIDSFGGRGGKKLLGRDLNGPIDSTGRVNRSNLSIGYGGGKGRARGYGGHVEDCKLWWTQSQ